MRRVDQGGPIERDEGAPGKIVELGKWIDPRRGHILDTVRRDDWRDTLRDGRAD
jgi:hypothetical protein